MLPPSRIRARYPASSRRGKVRALRRAAHTPRRRGRRIPTSSVLPAPEGDPDPEVAAPTQPPRQRLPGRRLSRPRVRSAAPCLPAPAGARAGKTARELSPRVEGARVPCRADRRPRQRGAAIGRLPWSPISSFSCFASRLLAAVEDLQLELPALESHKHATEVLPGYFATIDHDLGRA